MNNSIDKDQENGIISGGMKSPFLSLVLEWVESAVFAFVVVSLIFIFIFRMITVDGISMENNFLNADKLILNSISNSYDQGDVVFIVNTLTEGSDAGPIIKRVIATEGQEVSIDAESGTVIIDGIALDDSQFGIENGITQPAFSSDIGTELPAVVPKGCVFVLGDNRTVSKDSRYSEVGMVDTRNILGKAVFRVTPFERFGRIV